MNNREIICIHIGQAGIQIGNAVWELFSIEHELDMNGYQICYCPWPLIDNTSSLYFEIGDGKCKPRSLMIDSEPLVVEEIRTGSWNKMFDNRSLICGKEDASTIFAKGYKSCASDVLNESLTYLRILIEETCSLNGFLIFHSLGGGTGSGLTSRIAEVIQTETPKKSMIHLAIVPPTNKSGFIVEPYNGVLATAALLESSSLMCMMENQALYEAVGRFIGQSKLSFININRHIAQITSSLTTSYRFSNKLSSDFCVFQTNLVPFPEIHFPISSYAQSHESTDINLIHMTKSCFAKENMVLKLEPDQGCFMSCCLLYRGMNCAPMAINNAIKTIKSDPNNKFVDWSPTSFKVAINVQMPGFIPCADIPETRQSLCLLSNSTAIIQVWMKLLENFQNLFSRKAFLHWFVAEGVDESILKEAENRIIDLISKYKDLETKKDLSYLNKSKASKEVPSFLKKIDTDCPPTDQKRDNRTNPIETIELTKKGGKKNENAKPRARGSKDESVDEISGSHNQYNISSKYKELNGIITLPSQSQLMTSQSRNPLDSISESDSQVESVFLKFKNSPNQSLESIGVLHGSNLSIASKFKDRTFSEILHHSILDLPHLTNPNKLFSFDNSFIKKHFLSQFCRLNSSLNGSRSQGSICNIRTHSCQLNYSVEYLRCTSILYGHLEEIKHKNEETSNVPEIEYQSVDNNDIKITISAVNELRALISQIQPLEAVKMNSSKSLLNQRKHRRKSDMRIEIACQTSDRKSLSNRLTQIFYRKSTITAPKKPPIIFHKRHSFQKNFTPTNVFPHHSLMTSSHIDLTTLRRMASLRN